MHSKATKTMKSKFFIQNVLYISVSVSVTWIEKLSIQWKWNLWVEIYGSISSCNSLNEAIIHLIIEYDSFWPFRKFRAYQFKRKYLITLNMYNTRLTHTNYLCKKYRHMSYPSQTYLDVLHLLVVTLETLNWCSVEFLYCVLKYFCCNFATLYPTSVLFFS